MPLFQRTRCVFASKVAELIGHHRYNPQASAIYQLIAKWKPELIERRNQDPTLGTWEREVKLASQPLPAESSYSVTDSGAPARIQSLEQALVNYKHGQTEEPVAIAQYQAQHQTIVTGNNAQGFSLEIPGVDGTTRWILYGKVDGFDGQQLIEVKNRVNRLFCTIPLYERIQMECCMRITGCESCKLVQRHQDRLDTQILVRDDALWNNTILPGLRFVLERLDAFCDRTDTQEQHRIIVEPSTHTLVLEQIRHWFQLPDQ